MKKNLTAFVLILTLLTLMPLNSAFAQKKIKVLCGATDGTIVVRPNRCKEGEQRLNLDNFIKQAFEASSFEVKGPQGPQGPQGKTGPQGNQGDPAGLDVATCYQKKVNAPISGYAYNQMGQLKAECNNPANEFMLDSSFIVVPAGVLQNRPFLQGKQLSFYTSLNTERWPIGATYLFRKADDSQLQYAAGVTIVCCLR